MPAVTLTHALGPGGQLDACWGFGDGRPAWAPVPRSAARVGAVRGGRGGVRPPPPRLHRTVRRAWRSLYQFTGPAVDRARRCPGSLMGDTIAAWDAAGMRPEAVHRAATTVYNGIPTIE